MKMKTKKILSFCALALLVCSLVAFSISCTTNPNGSTSSNQTTVSNGSYALLLDVYKIQNYNNSVKVVDANGKTVEVNSNGEFIVTTPGRYVITSGNSVNYLYAYAKEPVTTFVYSENLNGKQLIAGDTIKIPNCDIQNAVKTYQDKQVWGELVARVIKKDFSWKVSAKEYQKLYDK